MMNVSNRKSVLGAASILAVLVFGVVVVAAQQGDSTAAEPEIFCLGLSAGQFCTHGSADLLNLEGAKRERWTQAAREYNQTVAAAQRRFLEEARAALSPEEYQRVEPWFDKSVNALLNQLLLAHEGEE